MLTLKNFAISISFSILKLYSPFFHCEKEAVEIPVSFEKTGNFPPFFKIFLLKSKKRFAKEEKLCYNDIRYNEFPKIQANLDENVKRRYRNVGYENFDCRR